MTAAFDEFQKIIHPIEDLSPDFHVCESVSLGGPPHSECLFLDVQNVCRGLRCEESPIGRLHSEVLSIVSILSCRYSEALSFEACFDDLFGELHWARKHDLVTAVHFKQFEMSKARRHARMKITFRKGLILAAGDEALRHAE